MLLRGPGSRLLLHCWSINLSILSDSDDNKYARNKAVHYATQNTIHQVTAKLAISKKSYFQHTC